MNNPSYETAMAERVDPLPKIDRKHGSLPVLYWDIKPVVKQEPSPVDKQAKKVTTCTTVPELGCRVYRVRKKKPT